MGLTDFGVAGWWTCAGARNPSCMIWRMGTVFL